MLFNSYEFLLYFLPLVVAGFFALGGRPMAAIAWLTAASFVFYAWWSPVHVPLLVASIWVNFAFGKALRRRVGAARGLLAAGVAFNLGVLGVFKYADFAIANVDALGGWSLPLAHLALPLGISFFTFTQIAYLVDVQRGRASEPSLLNYALFVTFFPHLLAGPIIHHAEMMPQFAATTNKRPSAPNFAAGLLLIAIGLAKKVFIADTLAPLADAAFANPGALTPLAAWIGVLAYTFQIYFDFSGYTDMALGAALLFNIRLPWNFDSPYRSTSLREFWHRWHMTLSRFLRDYLYIPLGGNRHGELRTVGSLLITFLLGGLWHGAAWTFVAWGAMHGAGIVVQRASARLPVSLPAPLAWAATFAFVTLAWVLFRAHSLGDAWQMMQSMTGFGAVPAPSSRLDTLMHALAPTAAISLSTTALAFAAAVVVTAWPRNSMTIAATFRPSWRWGAFAAVSVVLAVLQFGRVTPFLYFNF